MTRIFTGSVVALSIALSSLTVAPAQAGNNDEFGRFLAGALTLIIIGKAIEDNTKKNNRRAQDRQNRPVKKRARPSPRKILPNECFFRLNTSRGTQGVYGSACLNEFMRHTRHLPDACEKNVRIRYGRQAEVYSAKCLRKHGFRDSARRR